MEPERCCKRQQQCHQRRGSHAAPGFHRPEKEQRTRQGTDKGVHERHERSADEIGIEAQRFSSERSDREEGKRYNRCDNAVAAVVLAVYALHALKRPRDLTATCYLKTAVSVK